MLLLHRIHLHCNGGCRPPSPIDEHEHHHHHSNWSLCLLGDTFEVTDYVLQPAMPLLLHVRCRSELRWIKCAGGSGIKSQVLLLLRLLLNLSLYPTKSRRYRNSQTTLRPQSSSALPADNHPRMTQPSALSETAAMMEMASEHSSLQSRLRMRLEQARRHARWEHENCFFEIQLLSLTRSMTSNSFRPRKSSAVCMQCA
jgi:hypothetical protein